MKQAKLIDRLHSFQIDFTFNLRHVLFISLGMYVSYQAYDEQCKYQATIKEQLLLNKQAILDKYQPLFNKTYEGQLDVTLDQGNWLLSEDYPEIQKAYQSKEELREKFELMMPLYIIGGIGFPLLTAICGYQSQRDDRYAYGLCALAISTGLNILLHWAIAYNSFRIDLNLEFPINYGQYILIQGYYQNTGDHNSISPTYQVLSYLKSNSHGPQAQMFDVIQIAPDQHNPALQSELLECYQKNVEVLQELSGCTQLCSYQNMNISSAQIGYQQIMKNQSYYIIDNTQLPCENGTYFQMIQPWITLQAAYEIDNTFYYIERLSIIALVVFMIMEIMACVVLYYKLRRLKRKIKRKSDKVNMIKYPYKELPFAISESADMQEIALIDKQDGHIQ